MGWRGSLLHIFRPVPWSSPHYRRKFFVLFFFLHKLYLRGQGHLNPPHAAVKSSGCWIHTWFMKDSRTQWWTKQSNHSLPGTANIFSASYSEPFGPTHVLSRRTERLFLCLLFWLSSSHWFDFGRAYLENGDQIWIRIQWLL